MDVNNMTEEQKKQMDDLVIEAKKLGRKTGIFGILRILFMLGILITLNQLYMHSDIFLVAMSFVTAIFGSHMLTQDAKSGQKYLRQKADNILNNK